MWKKGGTVASRQVVNSITISSFPLKHHNEKQQDFRCSLTKQCKASCPWKGFLKWECPWAVGHAWRVLHSTTLAPMNPWTPAEKSIHILIYLFQTCSRSRPLRVNDYEYKHTLILSMLASILSCCTVRLAWAMLLELCIFDDIALFGQLCSNLCEKKYTYCLYVN